MRDSSPRRSWSGADLGIRLLIFVLLSVLLMALQSTGRLSALQSLAADLTSPGQSGMTAVAEWFTDGVQTLRGFRDAQQRAVELERISGSLLVENLRLQEVERENQRLRELLAFAETRPGVEFRGGQIIARPIGYDSSNFLEYIMIDLGRRHGIEIGMPVVNDQGLVGRISEVSGGSSKVLLITDPASTVNTILQSSRLTGVLRGTPGADPVMGFIPQDGEIAVGEIVVTSGMGANFPKGIPVGQVTEVRQRDFEIFQEAIIRPTVDFGRLELVMVVTNFDPLEILPSIDILPLDGEGPAPGSLDQE